jgi:hypothetical protein
MSARDLSTADFEGLLHTSSQIFANAQFASLDDQWTPCNPVEDALLTFAPFLIAMVAVALFVLWVMA